MENQNTEQAKTELAVIVKENALQPSKVETLLQSFAGSFAEAKGIVNEARGIVVTSEDQTDLMQKARETRLSLRRIRSDVESTRVQLKEQSLREGRAIDGMANLIKALVMPVEEHLEKQEKFAELLRIERAERINTERLALLGKYVDDVTIYNVRDMSEAAFNGLVTVCKTAYEAKVKAQAEADEQKKKAEEAEKKRIAKIEADNEKLRKAKAIADEKLAKERKAAEEAQAKLKAAQDAEAARVKAEADKKAAEKAAADEAARKALLAPDKDKIVEFAGMIDKLQAPNVASREAGQIITAAISELSRVSNQLREKAKTL